jgi:hypothetical protein
MLFMKKNVYSIFAFAIAIIFVGFTAFKTAPVAQSFDPAAPIYVTYDGDGPQSNIANYNFSSMITTQPSDCSNSGRLCWFKVEDKDADGDIQSDDFTDSFNDLDDGQTVGTLDDEGEITGVLSQKL